MGKSYSSPIEETMSYEGSGKSGLGKSGNRGPAKAKSRKKYASKTTSKKSKYIKPVKKDTPTPVKKPVPAKPVAPVKPLLPGKPTPAVPGIIKKPVNPIGGGLVAPAPNKKP